jgi:esterase/lipase superfamily enzyme
MSDNRIQSDALLDLHSASRALRRANACVLADLSALVDLRLLREGDFDDDYYVEVPCSRLPEVGSRLAQLKRIAADRFGVELNLMWIAV